MVEMLIEFIFLESRFVRKELLRCMGTRHFKAPIGSSVSIKWS